MSNEFIADPKTIREKAEVYAAALEAEQECHASVVRLQGQLAQSKEQYEKAARVVKQTERTLRDGL